MYMPWRKFRIGFNSETIRTIPNHSDICIRANANQSKPIQKAFWISFVEKHLKIIPIQSETSIWMNPNESEVNFQSEWMRINAETDWSKPNIHSIRMNPNTEIHSDWKLIRFRIDSGSYGLKIYFGFVRIHSDRNLGLNVLIFKLFSTNEIQNVFRIGSYWFALARIQMSEWFGIVLIGLEWIPIRNFRPGWLCSGTTFLLSKNYILNIIWIYIYIYIYI